MDGEPFDLPFDGTMLLILTSPMPESLRVRSPLREKPRLASVKEKESYLPSPLNLGYPGFSPDLHLRQNA
jgi:hypothetical protein